MSSSFTSASEARARRQSFGRYLVLLGLFTAGLAMAFLALVWASYGVRIDAPPSAIAARLLAKMDHAASLEGPRTLVFAGSQAFYNVGAKRLEEATGRPSVNLGTHGSQSLPFLVWQVEHVARRGDLVLLPLEYSFYADGGLTTYGTAIAHAAGLPLFAALPFREKIRYLRELHLPQLLSALAVRLGLSRGLDADQLSLNVTPRGDVTGLAGDSTLLDRAISTARARRAAPTTISPGAKTLLGSLFAWARAEGVTLLLTPPGTMDPMAPRAADRARLGAEIEALGGRYLDLPEGGAIPAEAMLDTAYHAAAEGAGLYTASLIVALCGADAADLSCEPAAVSHARKAVGNVGEHGFVFGEDPRLRTLRREGLQLAPGEALAFAVAAFRGCRDTLLVEGTGEMVVDVAGATQTLAAAADGARAVPLPRNPGLVDVTVRAGATGADLTSLRRVSDCGH